MLELAASSLSFCAWSVTNRACFTSVWPVWHATTPIGHACPCCRPRRARAKFDSSAVGRAARKAVDNVKKEREADAAAAAANKDNSRDWLT